MGCNCGSNRLAVSSNWKVVDTTGKTIKVYSSEMDARMASSRTPGTSVRPA